MTNNKRQGTAGEHAFLASLASGGPFAGAKGRFFR